MHFHLLAFLIFINEALSVYIALAFMSRVPAGPETSWTLDTSRWLRGVLAIFSKSEARVADRK